MGLNDTSSSGRIHIGFFGCRNAGKSSLINAVTGQSAAIVSPLPGTTTDAVSKNMELPPLGPVALIDTPGIDDSGPLGELRSRLTKRTLAKVDAAVLVINAVNGMTTFDRQLENYFTGHKIPFLTVCTHGDLNKAGTAGKFCVNPVSGEGVEMLKTKISRFPIYSTAVRPLIRDLLSPGDTAVLVVPLDESAPKDRLILPQQQTIRDILEAGAIAAVTGVDTLKKTLTALSAPPKIVITDSQVFSSVAGQVPESIFLTSFSILQARAKSNFTQVIAGAQRLKTLQNGERVLIAEGCTHQRQCGDIGTEKLPGWIRKYCQAEPDFHFCAGNDFPDNLQSYALIIHCGGCMLNAKEIHYRHHCAEEAGIPITNYGIAIAAIHGILERAIQPFFLPEKPAR